MEFSQEFFKSEYRDGFFVSSEMKRYWAVSIEILDIIDKICQKHNIKYFAGGGTLLGAIRHKGYIPWDDDIDIAMLREDYNRFEKIIEAELPEGFYYNSPHSSNGSSQPFGCVVNGKLPSCDEKWLERFYGCPYIGGVDVVPYDIIPRDKEADDMQKTLIQLLFHPIRLDKSFDNYEEERELALKTIEDSLNVSIDRAGNVTTQIVQLIDKVSQLYTWEEGDCVAGLCYHAYSDKNGFDKNDFMEIVRVPFEGITVPVQKNYHERLTTQYGDYMKPVKFLADHEYPVFKMEKREITRQKQLAKTSRVSQFLAQTFDRPMDVEFIKDYVTKGFYSDSIAKQWVARIPSESTTRFADYDIEKYMYNQLAPLEITDKLLGIVTGNGVKIVANIPNSRYCDKTNAEDMYFAMCALKALHESGAVVSRKVDLPERIEFYEKLWGDDSYNKNYSSIKEKVLGALKQLAAPVVLQPIHLNSTLENIILFTDNNGNTNIVLREFEQTAMGDSLIDIAMLAIDADYDKDELGALLEMYYGNTDRAKDAYVYCAAVSLMKNNMAEFYNRNNIDFGEKEQKYIRQAEYYLNI